MPIRTPPYLPFLDGAPDLTPGLKPIALTDWLAPDTEAPHWLAQKHDIMRTQRGQVFTDNGIGHLGDGVLARVSAATEGGIVDASHDSFEDWPTPLEQAAAMVSDDLCIMRKDEGQWALQAASLCAPTFWRLGDMLGKPLGGLHADVPGADRALVPRVARMFDGLQGGIVLERFNWTVQASAGRFTPDGTPLKALATAAHDVDALDILHLRVERQTICRLDEAHILFTIRVCIDPLRAALDTPSHVVAFQAAWEGISPGLAAYKGWPVYDRLVRAALRALS